MFLLAADTSGKDGSIALARCEGEACEVVEMIPLAGGTFSAQLVPQIAALLAKHGLTKRDVGGFAVASGPGSFTGLRVGLAAIKALAEVLQKPIATVSLLEAISASNKLAGEVSAALDAGRNEVYLGQYRLRDSQQEVIAERLLSREEFLNSVSHGATVTTPDEVIAQAARARNLPVIQVRRPTSDAIARMGWKKIQSGNTVSSGELEANYIRRSDAEIFSKVTS